jgi:Xaa-Pro aminopeptidase
VHGIRNSSRNTVAYGGEGDTVFQAGDIIRNDYVSYYHGYPGHQSRTVILGQPSADQQRTYRVMCDISCGLLAYSGHDPGDAGRP